MSYVLNLQGMENAPQQNGAESATIFSTVSVSLCFFSTISVVACMTTFHPHAG